jgi:phosphoglycolate phosphatase
VNNVRVKAYLFDLDGVLTDSRAGLQVPFRAALKAIGLPNVGDLELERFLGAPLPETFRDLKPDIPQSEIERGIKAFRAEYERSGIRKTRIYPGVPELLQAIVAHKATAWVVTLKPEVYAIQVMKLLALDRYVQGVCGAGLEETDTKGGLIARALEQAAVGSDEAIMLGDRHHDVAGALANGVLPVGALWGYGTYDELFGAGCREFSRSPREFQAEYVDASDARAAGMRRNFA